MLKENRVPNETYLNAFQLLRELAGDSRQVPRSYLVGILARYKVEKQVIANGGFAAIREGRLKGLVVAVKTIWTRQGSDIDTVYEVRGATGCKSDPIDENGAASRLSARNAYSG